MLHKKNQILDRLTFLIDENNKNVIAKNGLGAWFYSCLTLSNIFFLQIPSMITAIYLLKIGFLNVKDFLIALTYYSHLIEQSKNFLENMSSLETNVVCLERCESFINIPSESNYLNIKSHINFLSHNIEYPIKYFVPKKTNSRRDERYTYG